MLWKIYAISLSVFGLLGIAVYMGAVGVGHLINVYLKGAFLCNKDIWRGLCLIISLPYAMAGMTCVLVGGLTVNAILRCCDVDLANPRESPPEISFDLDSTAL